MLLLYIWVEEPPIVMTALKIKGYVTPWARGFKVAALKIT